MTSTTGALGIDPALIDNPFEVSPEMDRIFPVQRDVPGYSETAFLTTWNPDVGVGLFVHAGRCQQDLDLWWAQAVAYLPDGRLAVDRSWGRCPTGDAIQTGNLVVRMDRPLQGWTLTFDGAAELTTPALLAERPIGAGITRPMRWELRTEAAGPMWDMYAVLGHGQQQGWAQGSHTQQVLNVTGTLVVDGVEYSLDGVGGNDHSSGPRDISNFGSHHFLIGSLPGRSMHLLSVYSPDGTPLMEAGTMFRQGASAQSATLIDVPPLTDLDGGPGDFVAQVQEEDGSRTSLHIEVLHTAPLSIGPEGDNINGIEWSSTADVLLEYESRVRITTDDGQVGYAHLERSIRRSKLQELLGRQ